MRVTFVRYSLLSRGGDKMILSYAAYLAESGHNVEIETHSVKTVFPVHPRIQIVPIKLSGQLGTILTALFKKRYADVIVADIIPLAFMLFFRNRAKVVYFAQDHNITHYSNPFPRFAVRILNYLGLSLFKIRTIAVSEQIAFVLSRDYRANIGKVIENGIDTSQFYPEPSRQLQAEKNGRKSVLILSRTDQRKGFDIAVQVINKMSAVCTSGFEVWTVGDPAKDKFPGHHHRDFGYLPVNRLRTILSTADMFLYPSRSEGCPLMVLEAFACRCPVVTTEAVSYAQHQVNAMVSRIGDVDSLATQACRILEAPDIASGMTSNGYAFASAKSLDLANKTFADTLENIYSTS